MGQTGGRFEIKMTDYLKERLIGLADEQGVPVAEVIVKLVCQALGEDPARGLVPRKPPGRKPRAPQGIPARRGKGK